jgi:hypothetical protein
MLPWPARLPDISLIGHLWDMIGGGLLPRAPNNLDDLRHQLEVIWNEISQENVNHLKETRPQQVHAYIPFHGDVTHY